MAEKKTSSSDSSRPAQEAKRGRARQPAAGIPQRDPLEQAVSESEAVLRSFFDSSGAMRGVVEIVADDDVRHLADNAVTAGFLGLTPEAMQGKLGSELGEPKDILRTWIGHYRQSQSTGQPVRFEYLDQRGERQAWLLATVSYLGTTPQGNPRFSYIVSDITERKHAEQETQKVLDVVQAERDKLAALVNSMSDEVWLADLNKKFTLMNPSALREFTLAQGEVDIEKLAAGLEVYRPDGSPRPVEEAPPLRALRGEVVRNQEELVRTPGSKEFRHRQVSAAPVRDAAGEIIGSVSVVRDITAQVRMQGKLAASEQRLLLATQAAELGIYDHDLRSDKITWDQRMREIWGFGPDEEITYDLFMAGLPPDDRASVQASVERALDPDGAHKYHVEHRVIHRRDGTQRWIAATGDVYFDQGQAVRLIGTVQDITERKQAQEERERLLREVNVHAAQLREANERLATANEDLAATNEELRITTEELQDEIKNRRQAEERLRESEERFRRYFELGLIGMAITSPTKGWIEVNDECCRLLGYERDELIQKTWAQLTYPDDLAADVAQFDRVLAGRIDGYTMDKRFVRKNGQVVDTTISVAALRRADGTVDYFVVLLQDISERQQAEEALRASEERFRALTERGTDVVAIFDPAGEITYISPSIQALFGFATEEIVGRSVSAFIHPEDAERIQALIAEALCDPTRTFTTELRTRHKNGEWRWIAVAGRNLLADRAVGGIVANFQDITERRRAEEALREWNATLESKIAQRTAELQYRAKQLQKLTLQLSQAEEQERRRIAVILHEDLQQQIAGAKFHLSLVRGRTREDRQRADIDAVDEMLKGAIEKSRTLSRDLSPAVLHMNDLAELLQWLANRVRAQQGLSVDLDISGDMMLRSEALATFLFRAAQEMLFNVVKHARVRAAAVRVRRLRRYVCLSVSDQGRGFDPQELRETPGVGLFSIRERTESLGGRLKVKSAKGAGSTFRITVPDSQPVVAPPVSAVNLPQPGAAGPPSGGALRVLLVDDHDVVRAGLAALLRDTPGIELVGEAPDGRQAINLAAELRPDVVIMDVSMPLMSGAEATRQIKTHLPQTRVIALSMYDEAEKKEKMFEAGAEGYLLKTVSAAELLAALRGPSTDGDATGR